MLEIRRLRRERGWNQTELAFHAGLAPSVISQVENGKRDPSAGTLRKLAKALEVQVGDLFPKAQAPLPLEEAGSAGPNQESDEGAKFTHLSTLLENIGAAGSVARAIVGEWRDEGERASEGNWPTKYRALEMQALHNDLSRLYVESMDAIRKGAEQGIVAVGRDGDPQSIAPDPSLWPRELREYVYEAGAHIAVLPDIIRGMERAGEAGEPRPAEALLLRGGTDVREHLPAEMLQEREWREALDKALSEAGIPA